MIRMRLLAPLTAILVFASAVSAPAAQAQTADDAKALVSNLGKQVLAVIANKNLSKAQREARIRTLFTTNFHVRSIAVFVIGRHWRTATPAQKKAYLDTFEKFVIKTYTARLSQFAGETFEVIRASGPDRRGVFIVDTRIVPEGRSKVPLYWVIRKAKSGLRIVDIVIENLSMVQAQREDFAAIIRQRGSLDGLITALQEKVKALDAS